MESETLELQQVLFVGLVVALGNVIGEESHGTGLALGHALELEGTRNRIAGVLENFLAFQDKLLVQPLEGDPLHIDFATDFESALGNFAGVDFQFFGVKVFGNVRNGKGVQCHVVALGSVAAGGRLFQASVLIDNGKGNAVDFTLADPFRLLVILSGT